jgi:hypothetical protein
LLEPAPCQRKIACHERENASLRSWKESALAVEASWDCQAVGKALGLTLGAAIRPAILPGIVEMKAKLAKAKQELALIACSHVSREHGENTWNLEAVKKLARETLTALSAK